LVRLYLEEGEHGGAVRAYNEYEERLSRELSASPSAETVALVEWARARVVVRDDPAVVEVGVPEFKTRGLGRPSSRRSGRGLAAAALLTGVAGLAAFAWAQVNASAPLPLEESRVLVSAFENRTGGADLDALGRAVVDRLAGGLTEISFITVATDAEHSESGGAIRGASGADPVRLARELGAGVLVTGSFTASEDEVVFDARLVDVASGEVVAGGLRQNAPLADPGEALERLTDRVMAEVGARVDPRLASWSRHSSRPGTYEAYLTFVEALDEHVLRSRWARARELFLGLYEADTTFTMAALWGGMAAVNMGDAAFRDSLYAALDRRRSVLAPVDRYFLEGETSRRSRTRRLDAYRRLMDVAPGSDYATFASSAAFQAQRPSEAIAFLEAADLTRGWIWALAPWNGWAAALEALGRCAEIPELADRGQATMPARYADLYAEEMRLIAFACLGDTERFLEAARGMTAAVELSNLTGAWQGEIIAQHAQRLVTSGISDAERSEITEFVSEYMVERLHVRPLTPFRFSEFLATVGLEDSARVVLDRVRDEDGSWPWGEPAALRAIIEQRAGNEALADRLMEVVVRDERYGSPTWCDLCEAVLAGHRGELERAMDLVREEGLPSGAGWWEARSRPYFYGPLLDHPPFQEFIAPRG
jgi:TolB-like protein